MKKVIILFLWALMAVGCKTEPRDINQTPVPGTATGVKSSTDVDKNIEREDQTPASIPKK
ncbi:MAG: hypothetical protein M3Y82_08355 [Verrucomicrobiota bacterium]|nr:hypothetical protein [Verrucomicrobiota bacterium]